MPKSNNCWFSPRFSLTLVVAGLRIVQFLSLHF